MKYLLGVLALVAIVLILLIRGPSPSVPPANDPRIQERQPSTVELAAPNRKYHQTPPPPKEKLEEAEATTTIPSLEGTVISLDDGKLVSNVKVTVFHKERDEPVGETTSREGNYAIQHLSTGIYDVIVEGDDYYEGVDNVVVISGKTTRCDILLTSRSIIRGSVKDEGGVPVPDAEVTVTSQLNHKESTRTDKGGDYAMKISGQFHPFKASAPFHEEERKWIEGKPDRVDFVLRRKRRREIEVFGTVRDADGQGIPDVDVRIDGGSAGERVLWSDPAGTIHKSADFATATSSATGVYRIHAVLWGEANTMTISSEEYRNELPLTKGNNNIRHDITFPWKSTGITTVKGRIVDAITGNTLTDGTVSKPFDNEADGNKAFGVDSITTIRGRKRYATLHIESEGYIGVQVSVFHDPSHPREVDLGVIRLHPTTDVSVMVRDENGMSALADITFTDPESGERVVTSDRTVEGSHRYLIVIRPERPRVKMAVRLPLHKTHEEIITFEPGLLIDFREVDLKRQTPRTCTIMVTDNIGKPVVGAVIEYEPDGATVTDGAGRAAISAISDSCRVSADGYLSANVDLPEDQGTIAVSLKSPGVIAGTVVTEDGSPLPGAAIFCEDHMEWVLGLGGNRSSRATSDAQGRFELRRLPTGVYYRLWASHPYRDLRSEDLTEQPGATNVALVVKKPVYGELVIQFIGEDPPEGTMVNCELAHEGMSAFVIIEHNGIVRDRAVRWDKLDPGDHIVMLSMQGYAPPTIAETEIVAGMPTVIELITRPSVGWTLCVPDMINSFGGEASMSSPPTNLMEVKVSEAQEFRREAGFEGSAEQTRGLMNKNRI